jgi:hypothetical protein
LSIFVLYQVNYAFRFVEERFLNREDFGCDMPLCPELDIASRGESVSGASPPRATEVSYELPGAGEGRIHEYKDN